MSRLSRYMDDVDYDDRSDPLLGGALIVTTYSSIPFHMYVYETYMTSFYYASTPCGSLVVGLGNKLPEESARVTLYNPYKKELDERVSS